MASSGDSRLAVPACRCARKFASGSQGVICSTHMVFESNKSDSSDSIYAVRPSSVECLSSFGAVPFAWFFAMTDVVGIGCLRLR